MQRIGALYQVLLDGPDPAEPAAAEAFLSAIAAARPATDEERASIDLLHARGMILLGRGADAEAVLREALRTEAAPSRARALLHLDLAGLLNERREASSVLDLVARAESIAAQVPGLDRHEPFRIELCFHRCQAWVDLGRPERAAELSDELEQLAASLPDDARHTSELQRANVLLLLKAWEPVEALAERELSAPGLPPEYAPQWRLRRGQALAKIAHAAPARATEARRDLEAVLESARLGDVGGYERDDANLTLAELDVRAGDHAAARLRLADVAGAHADGTPSDVGQRAHLEALAVECAFAERADVATLREHARRIDAALGALRADWLRRPEVPGGQGFLVYDTPRLLLGQTVRLAVALEGEQAGVERAIAALAALQSAGTAARQLDQGPIDAGRIRRELLEGDASLLVLLPSSWRTHVLVLGPQGAVAAEGAAIQRLEPLRNDFVGRLFEAPDAARPERAGRLEIAATALRDALFDARIREALRVQPGLIVVGDELCGGLSLEALDLGGGRPLGVERAIAHAPSLPLAIALAARRRTAASTGPWDVIVFGVPAHAPEVDRRWPGLAALDVDDGDLLDLAAGHAVERVRVLARDEATLDALAAPGLAGARLLQIVAHGVHDASRFDPAGLVVATVAGARPVAWREDLRRLAAPRVVALWACGTQRGPARAGDDTAAHLGSAFLEAGATSAVVSRSDVALRPSLKMARRFSLGVAHGEAPAEALRAARELVWSDAATRDPFFHATVVLYGDPGARGAARAIEDSAPRTRMFFVLGAGALVAVLLAGLLGWALVRRRS